MTVFRSEFKFARVTFPPEQFGMGEGADSHFDSNGIQVKKPVPFRAIKFVDGVVSIENPDTVERMRVHSGNRAKGGADFWEESAAVTRAVNTASGVLGATAPDDGMTVEDKALLAYLDKAAFKMAPPQLKAVCVKTAEAMTRFQVVGIQPPTEAMGIRRVKARVIEMLGLLEDEKIWVKNNEGPTDIGGSTGTA